MIDILVVILLYILSVTYISLCVSFSKDVVRFGLGWFDFLGTGLGGLFFGYIAIRITLELI